MPLSINIKDLLPTKIFAPKTKTTENTLHLPQFRQALQLITFNSSPPQVPTLQGLMMTFITVVEYFKLLIPHPLCILPKTLKEPPVADCQQP